MHWVKGEPGGVDFERELVLVEHPPAEAVFVSAADTELSCAKRFFPTALQGRFQLVHAGPLRNPVAADAYVEETLPTCGLVVMRLLGGRAYFPHLLEAIGRLRDQGNPRPRFLLFDGSDRFDAELADLSDLAPELLESLFGYFVEGGGENFARLGDWLGRLIAGENLPEALPEPAATQPHGLYRTAGKPKNGRVWLLFYRAWHQAGDLAVADALADALTARGLQTHCFYSYSLRARNTRDFLRQQARVGLAPDLVLTLQSFSIAAREDEGASFFAELDCPVLQVPVSAMSQADWALPNTAMMPSEVAMNVALPELDGRVLATVAGFKEEPDPAADESDYWGPKQLSAEPDQVDYVADLAANWVRLRNLPNAKKRVALMLSNYPNKDGRIGNGVGLDTPASAVELLRALRQEQYRVDPMPRDAGELMAWLTEGATNDPAQSHGRPVFQTCAPDVMAAEYARLADYRRQAVTEEWGSPPTAEIPVSGLQLGNVFVGIQPARGYDQQTQAVYHSPDLVPPPRYLAFYAWLRRVFRAHAVVHLGKHGNLEWLPGRNAGLGADDFPRFCLGAMPLLYSFIVNNPGEGSQAKRRNAAVIVDHLTPPLTRAGLYGDLAKVERLLEELAHAATLYPKRQAELETEIRRIIGDAPWRQEFAPAPGEDDIAALDNFLCEIKESQIRSGLHILGRGPEGDRLAEFLIALLRSGSAGRPGLFELLHGGEFDWQQLTAAQRDELHHRAREFASAVIAGRRTEPALARLRVLAESKVLPRLGRCPDEIGAILAGLSGKFVLPGPAGAPTRGRLDVLPTGRNFYSLDPRTIPTETAWQCGQRMAEALLERHRQDTGEYPRTMAMVVWGTSNMRTGGDDLAQALWLWGCRPVWDQASGRVIEFEIVPANTLGRPRVDVLLRVSGLFRDAFGETMRLLASIPKRLCQLDEPAGRNPLRAAFQRDLAVWRDQGYDPATAAERAYLRVFSSAPGAYGAGLLPLIDGGNWQTQSDVADVFCRWGNYAYDPKGQAVADEALLRERLRGIEVVHQNQDNREHDILDSDDYFQFHGGLHAAVEQLSGRSPATYHGDSSMPERPKVRSLRQEFVRVLRSRVLNPKWIEAMRRHGYKGAFEIAASIDYLYGYDVTTGVAEDHQYEEIARRLLLDSEQVRFFRRHNPQALRQSLERLAEASDRGLWQDPDPETLATIEQLYFGLESDLE